MPIRSRSRQWRRERVPRVHLLTNHLTTHHGTRESEHTAMSELDPIGNSADIIDSRDVIARIEYLASRRDCELVPDDGVDELDDNETSELEALEALATEGEGLEDWTYGVALIRDSYFEDHARDFASDIGAIEDDAKWPCYCIDWQRAASELQMDYTPIEFGSVTYWCRW